MKLDDKSNIILKDTIILFEDIYNSFIILYSFQERKNQKLLLSEKVCLY